MGSMTDILRDMPAELFEDSDDEIVQVRDDDFVEEEHPPVYQEDIPNVVAQGLLSEDDYDENCRYQLIHSMDSTVLLKIDDSVTPEEEAAALEKDPNTTHLHLREIVLESRNDDVETYAEMHQNYVGIRKTENSVTIFARPGLLDYDLKKHHNWGIIASVVTMLLLLVIGVFLFYVTYQYK